jgi:hypothetical protein
MGEPYDHHHQSELPKQKILPGDCVAEGAILQFADGMDVDRAGGSRGWRDSKCSIRYSGG